MSDDPGLDTSGPDEDDTRIRALLAELGSGDGGPAIPPEVAARLDDTLARLAAERETGQQVAGAPTPDEEEGGRPGTVVPLRRRWLQRATAAAAAVIVVGAGGVAAANLDLLGNGSSTSSDSGAADSQVAESAPEPTAPSPGSKSLTGQESGQESDRDASQEGTVSGALPQVSAASFASDVTALLQRRAAGTANEKSHELTTPDEARQSPGAALRSTSCPGPKVTDGAVPHPIDLDGQPAVLLIHPEQDDGQLVEAWSCAGDRRLAETTITP